MDLARLLNIDPDALSWEKLAMCQNVDTELFFEKYESDESVARATDAMCNSCPVQKICLQTAIESGETGVWGGVYLEGGRVSRHRNQHKTPSVWAQVKRNVSGE
jgi:hypothetical protein